MIKDGITYKFEEGEYIKIRQLLSTQPWYTNKPLQITKINNGGFYKLEDKIKSIHPSNVIQDDECIKLTRKHKLNKLNK